MSDFRSFATILRTPKAPVAAVADLPAAPTDGAPAAATATAPPAARPPAAPSQPVAPVPPVPPARPTGQIDPQVAHVIKSFTVELRRLRARAAELFEMECETLLATLAAEVLARELASAPADIAALVARARTRIGTDGLRIRLSAEDAAAIDLPDIEVDPTLERGDAVFETESGTIDMRLGSRIRAVLGARNVAI